MVGSQATAVDAATGLAFVLTHNARLSLLAGAITVVNVGSGTVVRSVSLGSTPLALALDEQRGHVFVVAVGPLVARTTIGQQRASHGAGAVTSLGGGIMATWPPPARLGRRTLPGLPGDSRGAATA